jgi:hypothetical protein
MNKLVTIEINTPSAVSTEDLKEYIYDALTSSGGNRRPEDPLFHSLEVNKITITVIKRRSDRT